MNLADVFGVSGALCLFIGGFFGVLVGMDVNAVWREVADDGQRGAFLGAFVGIPTVLIIYLISKAG